MPCWTLKIWFCCLTPADQGGETPMVACREIYRRMDPLLSREFREKGLIYVRNFGDGIDVGWRDFFGTSNRAEVGEFCRNAGIDVEWTGGDRLRTKKLCAAVATHPRTGEEVFFNQLQAHHVSCLDRAVREELLNVFGEE